MFSLPTPPHYKRDNDMSLAELKTSYSHMRLLPTHHPSSLAHLKLVLSLHTQHTVYRHSKDDCSTWVYILCGGGSSYIILKYITRVKLRGVHLNDPIKCLEVEPSLTYLTSTSRINYKQQPCFYQCTTLYILFVSKSTLFSSHYLLKISHNIKLNV